ncbi:MAG: cupin [Gammaproteobacteria bacterium]|nr:cupin [Gammaproteobacteria bacterium]
MTEIGAAAVVLPGGDLAETIDFFRDRLGFSLITIYPADAPRVATMTGHGLNVYLDSERPRQEGLVLRMTGPSPAASLHAPNGVDIEIVAAAGKVLAPCEPRFEYCPAPGAGGFEEGRAGMQYRDLIPGRHGGRYIASHIRIVQGGPVPDYVHFHQIAFQMIYCYRGWVRVVYEDQGPAFVMRAGDCVLQPPQIRHQVLAASAGLEVIEIGCPAEHITCAEQSITLPTAVLDAKRDFGGQQFMRHIAASAAWRTIPGVAISGFEMRDTGIAHASAGAGAGAVLRPRAGFSASCFSCDAELIFCFVLEGTMQWRSTAQILELEPGAAVTVPANTPIEWSRWSDDLELLWVTVPGTSRITELHTPS